ncbi:MAG: DUF2892 domain-containing protein [Actinomycetota bacterium]
MTRTSTRPWARTGKGMSCPWGTAGGILLLVASPTALFGTLELLFVLAGLDLVVTGMIGHCPMDKKLGHMPRSMRRA